MVLHPPLMPTLEPSLTSCISSSSPAQAALYSSFPSYPLRLCQDPRSSFPIPLRHMYGQHRHGHAHGQSSFLEIGGRSSSPQLLSQQVTLLADALEDSAVLLGTTHKLLTRIGTEQSLNTPSARSSSPKLFTRKALGSSKLRATGQASPPWKEDDSRCLPFSVLGAAVPRRRTDKK
ncbi:hypothetical protein JZ751_026350 [Albula glossodonta]|uniref:Uncharacterized protein n=1 Tax=Albula glossodonta TaxID=121402 RepID=A0A8T2PLH8_9TELE|nr:hypothetical protein JZ751_026350 [Albula glossodonta]